MKKRTVFVCICLSAGVLLHGCAKGADRVTQRLESTAEDTTSEAVPSMSETPESTEAAPSMNETQESTEAPKVKANVQLYEGIYFDEGVYKYVDIPMTESPFVYCEIMISNITDTSFDFTISEKVMATDESTVIFPTSTAYFTGDGTEAAYYGKDQTLHFEFPYDKDVYPVVLNMKVTGLSKLEGNNYINNNIPGHEAG